jgi:hypothetical protein
MTQRISILSILLIVIGAAGAQAAEVVTADVPAVIAATPGAAAYPGADAVVLLREVSFTVDDVGRLTRREHVVTRLQSQWAMRNLSDVRVAWDGERQDLQIHTCRTFMADGREIPSPPNAFNEVTPDAVDRAVPFLGIREMVISHVGTEVNAVLDLDYEVRDRQPAGLPAWGEVFLQDRWPVREVTVRIAPASLTTALMHGEGLTGGSVDEPGACRWSFHDLPALPAQGAEAHRGDFTPHIVFSRAGSWEEVAAALRAAGDRATAELGPALQTWLDDGDDGDDRDLTKLDTLQRIAALAHDGVRAVNLPAGTWSRMPRPVADIYASAVATPWEQALLTQALLRAMNLDAEIGFFTRWQDPAREVAALGHFGDVRVVAALGAQNLWFAPSLSAAWAGECDLTGHTGVFLEIGGGLRVWKVPAGAGTCRLAVRLDPADGGQTYTTTADLELTGTLREGRGEATAVATELAKKLVSGGEATKTTVRSDTPQALALRVLGKGSAAAADTSGLIFASVPLPRQSILDRLPSGFRAEEPARSAPLFVDSTLREEVTITVNLAPGQTVDALPAARDLSCTLGAYRLEVEEKTDCLVVRRTLELRAGRCDPADYPALRAMLAEALRQDVVPLVLVTD